MKKRSKPANSTHDYGGLVLAEPLRRTGWVGRGGDYGSTRSWQQRLQVHQLVRPALGPGNTARQRATQQQGRTRAYPTGVNPPFYSLNPSSPQPSVSLPTSDQPSSFKCTAMQSKHYRAHSWRNQKREDGSIWCLKAVTWKAKRGM